MNRFIVLIALFLFSALGLSSQNCLPDGIVFSTQEDIDNFSVNYPGCVTIEGNVLIGNSSGITNLIGLQNITQINGSLSITSNQISSLNGLENLSMIEGSLDINNNTILTNLTALDNLTILVGNLNISYNPALSNISGFNNLTSMGDFQFTGNEILTEISGFNNLVTVEQGFFDNFIEENPMLTTISGFNSLAYIPNTLTISNNSLLESITGFSSLLEIDDLTISGNTILTDLSGFGNTIWVGILTITDNNNLTSINSFDNVILDGYAVFEISNNPNLMFCSILGICVSLENDGLYTISNNGPGCTDEQEVLILCEPIGRINSTIFIDYNQNGIQDNLERAYLGGSISFTPIDYTTYSTPNKGWVNYLPYGSYNASYNPVSETIWDITSGGETQTTTLSLENPNDSIAFPIYPLVDFSRLTQFIALPNIRCNSSADFEVVTTNEGNTVTTGISWVQVDSLLGPPLSPITFDTTAAPNRYGWKFNNLFPGETFRNTLRMITPSQQFIGDTLFFESFAVYSDVTGDDWTSRFFYADTPLECAYDPNDKLVNPARMNGYSLFEEDLYYTVRFQNTGNAEAWDIVIRDTLDPNLDPTTFKVISSSHEEVLSTTLIDDRFLSFDFRQIFLPDSTTNFEASQGYVSYRIKTKDGIAEETQIRNTASIYFDFNPPIVTNTTENIMLSTFDFDEDGFELFVDCDDKNASVYPGAMEIPGNGVDEDCDGNDATVSTDQIDGHQIQILPNPTNDKLSITIDSSINAHLTLRDSKGQLMIQSDFQNQKQLDLSTFPQGIYLLTIQTAKGLITKRILKM